LVVDESGTASTVGIAFEQKLREVELLGWRCHLLGGVVCRHVCLLQVDAEVFI
jgi:hypothetical protein